MTTGPARSSWIGIPLIAAIVMRCQGSAGHRYVDYSSHVAADSRIECPRRPSNKPSSTSLQFLILKSRPEMNTLARQLHYHQS